MRILEEFKIKQLFKMNQVILLDEQARVWDSCDALFSTQHFRSKAVFEVFPIVESIFSAVLEMEVDEPEIRLSKVERPAAVLPGFYDFTFKKIRFEGKELILWSIHDYTKPYEDFLAYQQRRNEFEIHLQRQAIALQKANKSRH